MILIKANTASELADALCKAVKEKSWHVFSGTINGKAVEVKAFGKWLQIFRIDGLDYSEPEFKTQLAMRKHVTYSIHPVMKAVEQLSDYFTKGWGIYNWTAGGRYFQARVTPEMELECFDGEHWRITPLASDWRGPNGERVYIHGRVSQFPDSATRGNGVE